MTKRKRREAELQRQQEVHEWREREEAECKCKKRYSTRDEAVNTAKLRRAWGHEPSELWCYHCPHCQGFHLTRTPHMEPPVA